MPNKLSQLDNLPDILTLKQACDIPMLEIVDHPICFNPNRMLYDQAIIKGWEVVVEREDVVYGGLKGLIY